MDAHFLMCEIANQLADVCNLWFVFPPNSLNNFGSDLGTQAKLTNNPIESNSNQDLSQG